MPDLNQIINTDAISGMQQLADQSVNSIVTSPPYFGLRAYGTTPYSWPCVEYSVLGFPVTVPAMACELGQEPTHWAFIGHLVLIFRQAHRVLRDDGTLWLNMGDSYASPGRTRTEEQAVRNSGLNGGVANQAAAKDQINKLFPGLKPKDLIGIPWMLAYALRDDGWYLRSDIIWSKPNPMPESVTDRPTKSHEYIFLLSKSEHYYYDYMAIRTPAKESSINRWQQDIAQQDIAQQDGSTRVPGKTNGNMKAVGGPKKDKQRGHSRRHAGFNDRWDQMSKEEQMSLGANKRSVWTVSTKPFKDAHFATYPQDLITDCIKAGCPEDGVVLDPFSGSGTTAIVAKKLFRNFYGIELNPVYHAMSLKRLHQELGFFA